MAASAVLGDDDEDHAARIGVEEQRALAGRLGHPVIVVAVGEDHLHLLTTGRAMRGLVQAKPLDLAVRL